MADLISRQAAIDAIQKAYADTEGGEDKNAVWKNVGLTNALHIMQDLPLAQPETHEKRTETHARDCISRQAAIDFIDAGHLCNPNEPRWSDNEIVNFLKSRPSAQPEIIRCGECKHWMPYEWMFGEIWRSQNIYDYSADEIGCEYGDMTMKAYDFCSRAERREG